MGFKLAMPNLSAPKSESSALAQTHARLKAWWNGHPAPKFEVVEPVIEAAAALKPHPGDADPYVAHTHACLAIWGEGRTYPLHTSLEEMLLEQVGANNASRLAVFDGGAGGLAFHACEVGQAKIDVFDENPHRLAAFAAALKSHKQAKRLAAHAFDWQPGSLPKAKVDAALFLFRGGLEGRLEASAFGAERMLRAGGNVLWLDFFAHEDSEQLNACRGFEKRTFQTQDEAIIAFAASGLDVKADDDWSARYTDGFDKAWNELQAHLSVRQAKLIKQGGMSAGTAAIGDLMTWKARAQAVASGQLHVRRILASK